MLQQAAGLGDDIDAMSMGQRLADAIAERGSVTNGVRAESNGGIRAFITTGSSTVSAGLAAGQPQMVAPQERPLFLRDLVPVIPASTYSVPFVRELNPQSGDLAVTGVAEAATKGDASAAIDFAPYPLTPGTLPCNVTVSDQLINDSPAFASYLDARLGYLVGVREEYAAFNGNGETSNANVIGVLNDSNVTPSSPGAGLIQAALKMCGTLAGNGVIPSAVFCNASDYYTAAVAMLGSGYAATILSMLPQLIPTVSLAAGTIIAGDWANGAVFVEREEVSVQTYPQHSDYRARNQLLVQAEERITFGVIAPWRFTYATGITP